MKKGTPSKVETTIPRNKKEKSALAQIWNLCLSPKLFLSQVKQIIKREGRESSNIQRALSLEEVSTTTTHLEMDEAWKQIKQREKNDFSKNTKLRRRMMFRIFTKQLAPIAYKMLITST